ncbi:hypothetical protein LTR37_007248 [Vermiconidia calcicola]|uniref:Uncharacterized protein n=1 Tax=Vermiconidia calcicola TaxID=1690605 RepID=A0ACC3NEW2_9PEZI|nr:hypothetical protein LTR37_007248 [Vermiconidia calcicola]
MAETFVARRWQTEIKDYVDTKNRRIPMPPPVAESHVVNWQALNPPADGSTPFLSLPTELRLQIYAYLTTDTKVFALHEFNSTFDLGPRSNTKYAYLYRSPGRITKLNSISKQIIKLLHVCHRMREELIDACFSDRTFILEASLYRIGSAGLKSPPLNLGPTAWVKRLLLITTVELDGHIQGIADLRQLQQMVNLEELRVIFLAKRRWFGTHRQAPLQRNDDVLKALLECVPASTVVRFESHESVKDELQSHLNGGIQYLFENEEESQRLLESTKANMLTLTAGQGKLSGSLVNHGECRFPMCDEGLGAV